MPIILDNVSYTYQPGTPNEVGALKKISLKIKSGQFIGIIGHTGSGKSTLIQHLNGLLFAQEGQITVDDMLIAPKSKDLKEKMCIRDRYEDEEQSLEGLAATGTGLPEPPEPGAAEELAVRFLSDERFRGCTPLLWTPAEDGAYGLTGVVLYEDSRENNVCNLAFALDTYFHPLCFAVNEREGQRDFDILEDSQLTYLGEGKVGVSVKRIGTDEIYDYQISYSAGAAEGVGNVHFTASSQLRE